MDEIILDIVTLDEIKFVLLLVTCMCLSLTLYVVFQFPKGVLVIKLYAMDYGRSHRLGPSVCIFNSLKGTSF